MLSNAFNSILKMNQRPVSMTRPGGTTISTYITPSNYFRNLAAPSDITIEGREFIISFNDLGSFGVPKKGDRITDPAMGVLVLSEVREMFGIGSELLGYRVRTS